MAAWLDEGHTRVRLNPDSVYLAELSGAPANLLPDNLMGTPVPWPKTYLVTVPDKIGEISVDQFTIPAAILEACDRVAFDNWSENLSELLLK